MSMDWFCLDCNLPTELNRFGNCERCGSIAVVPDRAAPPELAEERIEAT